jgi:hypothetical protein
MFSRRSQFDRRTNLLALARLRALESGQMLLDLCESNPTRAGLPGNAEAITALASPDAGRYEPSPFGMLSARRAVSAWMARQGQVVDPERIVLTSSTSEAYAFLFKLLCDPGDDVLIPSPGYPLFEHLAQLESVGTSRYALRYDGRWHVPADALQAARTRRTQAIVTVHPNNPTGSFLKRTELDHIAALGLPIVSDEVFAPYPLTHDATRVTSALQASGALVFTLHGLSKLAGLPQLKLAWICIGGPPPLVDEALARLELVADSFLSVATPVQVALPTILATHNATTHAIRTRIAHNLAVLAALTAGTAASALHVEGGWYGVLRLPNVLDDQAWALDALQHAHVLVQPGYFYDFDSGPYIVLSLLTPEATFSMGLTRLLARIEAVIDGGA